MDCRDNCDEEAVTAQRAAEWLTCLDAEDPRDKEGFLKWLGRSPENCGEVLIATSTDLVMRQLFRNTRIDVEELLSSSTNVVAVGSQNSHREQRKPRVSFRFLAAIGLGIAAAVAAVPIVSALLLTWLHPNEYRTSIGEQRAIELPDGSVIAINAQSSVRVAYSESSRDVYLNAGQAMFTVAKDSTRPFRVHVTPAADDSSTSKDTIIQALGTKFDVRRRSDRINVAVIEGVVQVRSDARTRALDAALAQIGELAKVAAGEAVSIESTGLITPPAQISVSDVSAWQQRRLVFVDDTLEEITEEFQRYNRSPQIRIEGEQLRARRLSGVFDADNPEALLMYLASDTTVSMEHDGDDLIIRLRDDVAQPQIAN